MLQGHPCGGQEYWEGKVLGGRLQGAQEHSGEGARGSAEGELLALRREGAGGLATGGGVVGSIPHANRHHGQCIYWRIMIPRYCSQWGR